MPKLSGVNHLRAIKALEKAGFRIERSADRGAAVREKSARYRKKK